MLNLKDLNELACANESCKLDPELSFEGIDCEINLLCDSLSFEDYNGIVLDDMTMILVEASTLYQSVIMESNYNINSNLSFSNEGFISGVKNLFFKMLNVFKKFFGLIKKLFMNIKNVISSAKAKLKGVFNKRKIEKYEGTRDFNIALNTNFLKQVDKKLYELGYTDGGIGIPLVTDDDVENTFNEWSKYINMEEVAKGVDYTTLKHYLYFNILGFCDELFLLIKMSTIHGNLMGLCEEVDFGKYRPEGPNDTTTMTPIKFSPKDFCNAGISKYSTKEDLKKVSLLVEGHKLKPTPTPFTYDELIEHEEMMVALEYKMDLVVSRLDKVEENFPNIAEVFSRSEASYKVLSDHKNSTINEAFADALKTAKLSNKDMLNIFDDTIRGLVRYNERLITRINVLIQLNNMVVADHYSIFGR